MLNTHLHHLHIHRTKYYLPRHKGYANEIELDDSSPNVQSLSIIQNPALVAKPYGNWNICMILSLLTSENG